MAIIDVKLKWSGESGRDEMGGRRRRSIFTVLSDDAEELWQTILAASGLPQKGDPDAGDGWLVCRDRTFRRPSPHLWEITCNYQLRKGGQSTSASDNPLEQAPEISWGSSIDTEPVDVDIAGKAIRNTAGERFDPGLEREFVDLVLTITRNQETFEPVAILVYMKSRNAVEFYGAAPGVAMMDDISGQEVTQGELKYVRVSYRIKFRMAKYGTDENYGWTRRVANQGFRERTAAGNLKQIVDQNGVPVSEPVDLDADGLRLAAGLDTIWLSWDLYELVDWDGLGLQ